MADAEKVELQNSLTKVRAKLAACKKENGDDLDFIKVCEKEIIKHRKKLALRHREIGKLERERHGIAQPLKRKRNK